MKHEHELYDVTIIGGGPAGMYAAFYCGMRDMKTKIIEVGTELGGQVLLYPEKTVWDVGGVPPVMARELVNQMKNQATVFEPDLFLGEQVVDIQRDENQYFLLTTDSGKVHYSKTVILAMGRGVIQPTKLDFEGIDQYEVSNLYYTVQELDVFRGKKVLISGGGDSAVDWANELVNVAEEVMVVHRRDHFGGLERNVKRLKESSAILKTPYELHQLHGDSTAIQEVTIKHRETDHLETHRVDAVIVNHGMRGEYGPLAKWGIDTRDGRVAVNEKRETSVPGIFGAGNVVAHEGHVPLIAAAITDSVLAVNAAKRYLEPEATEIAMVSSHNERFASLSK
ncbi:NAD(P)/FAD-dependent oxidoreductase [Paenibacillus sp. Marseille-Q4541]|uniref:NAD(P)/FAD-dependent oxidoreductase n=1 Tax=Paenibacillus sp. Marseille-Q4541 TaxID=2831522 RepID=UPI001BA84445|nr:NAD(P)/FAD-dependent oxidoreductase [Paenibacillus sp. Marseille-Q4541]